MAKFKVGDKVRIREDLEVDKVYGDCQFICDMENLKGEIVTIEEVLKRGYLIKEYYYLWSEEMLEEFEEHDLAKRIIDDCIKERDEMKNNRVEKTFREVIADIKPGEVWRSANRRITLDNLERIIIDGSPILKYFDPSIKYTLERKEYTFEEAFKAYEEGKEIESIDYKYKKLEGKDCYKDKDADSWDYAFGNSMILNLKEIRGKWYIND